MKIAYLLVLLLLYGCETKPKISGGWERDGATSQEFFQDRGQCVAQSYAAPTMEQRLFIMAGCMQGKGWYWRENP